MRVYTIPPSVKDEVPDWTDSLEKYEADIETFHALVAKTLRESSYTGLRTGNIYSAPAADGYAVYMVAQKPTGTIALVHMPYGDAYESRDVEFLSGKEILRRIDARAELKAIFSKH